jgi:pimeloyl-ACP methyl ester carboxylesterase
MIENLIRRYIRLKILPSSIFFGKEHRINDSKLFTNCNSKYHGFDEFYLPTDDNVRLNTMSIFPNKQEQDFYLLCFLGNYQNYESLLPELLDISIENKCNLLTFNYRGVCRSTGEARNIHDLFRDGISQVENLLKRGVDPRRIIIRGFSLGGAIATKVVHHFHKRGKKLYLFSDRSFSRVSDVASAWYGSMLRSFFSDALHRFKWEFDAARLYAQLPAGFKSHINLGGDDDDVIPFKASLASGLYDLRQKLSEENILYAIKEFKAKAHSAPLDKIFNKYGQNGRVILNKFISGVRRHIPY